MSAYTDGDVLVAMAAEVEWFFEGRSAERGRMETVVAEMAPRIAARAKAEALREAATWLVDSMTCKDDGCPDERCDAIREAAAELRARAGELERGAL